MAISYYSSINLHKNEVQNFVVHNAASISSPSEGQMYYDTDDNTIYFNEAATGATASWVDIGASGDISGVTAGVGLSGGGSSGGVTLTLDLSELSTVTPADGDFFATLDSDGSTEQKTTTTALATLFAGTGLGASSSVLSVDAAQTVITSLLATDIKIGEDDQTKIDFETADEIHFYAANVEQVYVADNIFGPQSDSDVDLGTTGVRWKDAFVDSITVTGEVDGASLDISGNADIDGTLEADVLTVDGSNILTGGIITTLGTIAQDTVTVSSANADDPLVIIKNTTNDATGARLRFVKDKGAAGAADDECGTIEFYGDDASQDQVLFSEIKSQVAVHTNGQEGGKLSLGVATHDGEMQYGLILTDGSAEDEIDVTIGSGSSSVTTIAGDLTVSGTTTTVSSTTLSVTDDLITCSKGNDTIANANGSGLEIDATGATNIYWKYVHANTAWQSNVDIDTSATGNVYKINGTEVLGPTTLGSGVVTTSVTTVGALDSGSITSGFGTIDTGSSAITTTGLISGGSLDIDHVLINGTTIGHTDDTDLMTVADGVLTIAGELDATTLDISGNADIDGTTNLDAVDIDGAVQIDATFTSGVDGQGYDTKFFGDTASAYLLWDTSADKLLTAGGAVIDIVKDKLLIGGTAVTTTAAELNVLDAVSAGTVTASLGVVVDSNKDIGSFRNITLTGELDAGSLDVSGDADIDGTLETDALTIGGSAVLAQATASAVGAVELATSAETITGTDTARVVTPDGLAARTVVQTIAAGSLTDDLRATVTHSLGTADTIVQLYDMTTEATVFADVGRTTDDMSTASTSVITIDFGTAPSNDIRCVITSFAGATAGSIAYT